MKIYEIILSLYNFNTSILIISYYLQQMYDEENIISYVEL